MTINKDNFKSLALVVLIILVIALWLTRCEKPVYIPNPKLTEVYKKIEVGKFLKKEVQAKTDTVIKYRDRWHKAKETYIWDTTYHEIISICDTLVKSDSVLIEAQNRLILNQDSTIHDLLDVHRKDSLSIHKLEKKLKRQKVLTKIALVGGFISGGGLGFNLSR